MSFFTWTRPAISITFGFAFFDKFRFAVASFHDKINMPQRIEHHGNGMQHCMKDFILIAIIRNAIIKNFTCYRVVISKTKIIKAEAIEISYISIIDGFNNVLFSFTDKKYRREFCVEFSCSKVL